MSILATENVTMQFGGVVAVDDLNLKVEKNEIVSIIGPNGAGKTTTFNVITGVYAPTKGRVYFNNKDITGKKPNIITKMGIARTFQNIRLFKDLTVFDNVIAAKHLHVKSNFLQAAFRIPKLSPYCEEEKKMIEETNVLLNAVGLYDVKDLQAKTLPYGEQRRLEIARAMATNPKLLLLDEPAAGMNPKETVEITDFIAKIRKDYKLSILIIEHHMDLVMEISDKIFVVDFGITIAEGKPSEIQNNERVINAYLGVDEHVEA